MGFHGIGILYLSVKIDGLTTLRFPTSSVLLVFVWVLHVVLFRVNLKYFDLLLKVFAAFQKSFFFALVVPSLV